MKHDIPIAINNKNIILRNFDTITKNNICEKIACTLKYMLYYIHINLKKQPLKCW